MTRTERLVLSRTSAQAGRDWCDIGLATSVVQWALKMSAIKFERAISTGKLNASPRLHIRPINVVVYHGS
jgi:hypothetical protein